MKFQKLPTPVLCKYERFYHFYHHSVATLHIYIVCDRDGIMLLYNRITEHQNIYLDRLKVLNIRLEAKYKTENSDSGCVYMSMPGLRGKLVFGQRHHNHLSSM